MEKSKLIEYARDLRKNQTNCEKLVWSLLRNKKIADTKFRRQYPFKNYILDFYCADKKIAIELDGSQHYSKQGKAKDTQRDKILLQNNIKVLRFSNYEVLTQTDGVLEMIYNELTNPSPVL